MIFNLMRNAFVNVVIDHNKVIPEGGTYYVSPTPGRVGDYSGATAVYTAGDYFPETPSQFDCYVYGDYEYRYECNYKRTKSGSDNWLHDSNTVADAWGVRVLDETKTEYGKILGTIANAPVACLACAFAHCVSMQKVPDFPTETVSLRYVCNACTALGDVTGLVIPATVTTMFGAFQNCDRMTGEIVVNANPSVVTYCFSSTANPIFLTGDSTVETKKALAETSSKGNVTYENTAEPIAYSYNGTILPPLPEWDKETYPSLAISKFSDDSACRLVICQHQLTYAPGFAYPHRYEIVQPPNEQNNYYGDTFLRYRKKPNNDNWEPLSTSNLATVIDLVNASVIWSNMDILNEDGSVYFKATEPIPLYE